MPAAIIMKPALRSGGFPCTKTLAWMAAARGQRLRLSLRMHRPPPVFRQSRHRRLGVTALHSPKTLANLRHGAERLTRLKRRRDQCRLDCGGRSRDRAAVAGGAIPANPVAYWPGAYPTEDDLAP